MKPVRLTVAGHRVELVDGPCRIERNSVVCTVRLTRMWWAPLPLAWQAAGAGDHAWWFRPIVFVLAFWSFVRARGGE